MADQASLRARVVALVLPSVSTTSAEIDTALLAGFITLDKWHPRRIEESLTLSDGEYDLTGLASWEAGFSRLSGLEYPLDDVPVSRLPVVSWRVNLSDGLIVQYGGTLAIRAEYTAKNTVPTLTDSKAESLALLGAADLMSSWASKWTQHESVAVAGEDHQGPSPDNARRLAKELTARARATMPRVVFTAG